MNKLETWTVIVLATIIATLTITIAQLAMLFQPVMPYIGGQYV